MTQEPTIVDRAKDIEERKKLYDECQICKGDGMLRKDGLLIECFCHARLRA